MTDATVEFFDALGRRGHEPRLLKASGTLRWDLVDGDTTEQWYVAVSKGDVTVSKEGGPAGCVARTERAVFDRLASGEANAMAAVLRGALGVEGDVELLVLFQRLFPGRAS
jgi:hypothetical protein